MYAWYYSKPTTSSSRWLTLFSSWTERKKWLVAWLMHSHTHINKSNLPNQVVNDRIFIPSRETWIDRYVFIIIMFPLLLLFEWNKPQAVIIINMSTSTEQLTLAVLPFETKTPPFIYIFTWPHASIYLLLIRTSSQCSWREEHRVFESRRGKEVIYTREIKITSTKCKPQQTETKR